MGFKEECAAQAQLMINNFYQPLGKLRPAANNNEMWEYAKQRAIEVCQLMLNEQSCYILEDPRWAYWKQVEIEIMIAQHSPAPDVQPHREHG
jgi:hypothetical protein